MAARHEAITGSLPCGGLGARRFEFVSVHRNDTFPNNFSIFEHTHRINGTLERKSRAHIWINEAVVSQLVQFIVEFPTQLGISPTHLSRSNANDRNLFY